MLHSSLRDWTRAGQWGTAIFFRGGCPAQAVLFRCGIPCCILVCAPVVVYFFRNVEWISLLSVMSSTSGVVSRSFSLLTVFPVIKWGWVIQPNNWIGFC